MEVILPDDWANQLEQELQAPYMEQLLAQLETKYEQGNVYPNKEHIFNAFHYTPYKSVKVVILGQDPYHGAGQAHGLSFSVQPGIKVPPSLQNIYKELAADIGCDIPAHGCLDSWAEQGVLLLNSVLTVDEGAPNSHQRLGWERFTDAVIAALNEREAPVVFILWGNHAQAKAAGIRADRHYIIASAHPSPLAARKGFIGSKPFSRANAFLAGIGSKEIDWQVPNREGLVQEHFAF